MVENLFFYFELSRILYTCLLSLKLGLARLCRQAFLTSGMQLVYRALCLSSICMVPLHSGQLCLCHPGYSLLAPSFAFIPHIHITDIVCVQEQVAEG